MMTNEELVKRIKAGGDAKEYMLQLWQQNKKFISLIAQKYVGSAEKDDLEQEGYLALCRAVDGYNADADIPFINYAAQWLHAGMRRYIENCGNVVRISAHERQRQRHYKRVINEFMTRYGRQPTQMEIAELMELTVEQIESVEKSLCMSCVGSLDSPMDEEEGESTIEDMIAGSVNVESDVLDRLEEKELRKVLWAAVDMLPGKQPQILRMRYQQGKTLKEIGNELDMSSQNAHELQYKAFREIRKKTRSKKLDPFLIDYIGSRPYQCNGVGMFNRTFTSSTEFVALQLYEDF